MGEADSTKNLKVAVQDCSDDILENTNMLTRKCGVVQLKFAFNLRYTVAWAGESTNAREKRMEREEEQRRQGIETVLIKREEDDSIRIDPDVLNRMLLQMEIGDTPIAIISIAGCMRTGKSFLLNYSIRYFKEGGMWALLETRTTNICSFACLLPVVGYACLLTEGERMEKEEEQRRQEMEKQKKEREEKGSIWIYKDFERHMLTSEDVFYEVKRMEREEEQRRQEIVTIAALKTIFEGRFNKRSKRRWEQIKGPEAASPFKPTVRSDSQRFPDHFGTESTGGNKERGTVIQDSFSKFSDNYSFIQSQREIGGDGKRKLKENVNGNDIFSDKNFNELFGMLKAESIYKMTKWEGNEWAVFVTNNLGIPPKKLRAMRREVGSLTTRLKMEFLKYWREKNGSNGADLVELVKKFMRITEVTSYIENIPFEDVCRAVVGLIGDESWMKFVRIELGLTEDEIKELRMEYADFTEEQKFQIIKRWIQHEKKIRRNRLKIRGGGLQHETQE